MRSAAGCPKPSWLWLIGLVLLQPPAQGAAAGEAVSARTEIRTPRSAVVCDAAVQHPIQVRVQALDPVRRGATVRLRLTSRSGVALTGAEARIVSLGGAAVVGRARSRLDFSSLEREASTDFTLALPATGKRFLVEFRVEGEGPAGRIGRGASFNLLPDGPSVAARTVTGASGHLIAEYPARRIPR